MLAKINQEINYEDKLLLVQLLPLFHQVADIVLNTHARALHDLSRLQLLFIHPPRQVSLIGAYEEIEDNLSALRGSLTKLDFLHEIRDLDCASLCVLAGR